MAAKKPTTYPGQPPLKKHTPNDAHGKGVSPGQPRLIKHSAPNVSTTSGRSGVGHPNDRNKRS